MRNSVVVIIVAFFVLLGTPVHAANLMTIAVDSLLAIDLHQTSNWYMGTHENPVTLPNGLSVVESNPLIAGNSWQSVRGYFFMWSAFAHYVDSHLADPWKTLTLGTIIVAQAIVVSRNNSLLASQDMPRYIVLEIAFPL